MKILFMGTPDFASEILDSLHSNGYNIIGAVSQPDKPKGRGHKLMPTDVKLKAEKLGIALYQPQTLKDEAFLPTLKELDPDLIVVAAYGKILPDYIIDYPRYGCINVHASLLPKYRGAAPIQRAILNGDEITGVSIMRMSYGLDTGDVISVESTPIGEYETSGELFDRLAKTGGNLLCRTLKYIFDGTATYTQQDDALATYAEKITKETAKIDWARTSAEISKQICAMSPYPGSVTMYNGDTLKIYEAQKTEGNGECGQLLGIEKGKGLKVACGDGALYLKTVQFSGSKKMDVEDYARGHDILNGAILGN